MTEQERDNVRIANCKATDDNGHLRGDNERVCSDNYERRKQVENTEGRNADLQVQIRDAELRLKEKEEAVFCTRKDVEYLRSVQANTKNTQNDLLAEKEALEKHCACMVSQNTDLTHELERFVTTDEMLR